jgi:hypothetical protein
VDIRNKPFKPNLDRYLLTILAKVELKKMIVGNYLSKMLLNLMGLEWQPLQ